MGELAFNVTTTVAALLLVGLVIRSIFRAATRSRMIPRDIRSRDDDAPDEVEQSVDITFRL